MMRTTIYLPETLYQRLQIVSKNKQQSLSRLITVTLDKVIAAEEETRRKRMYATLKELEGIGNKEITDTSTTIDKLLYGEKGAWQGSGE